MDAELRRLKNRVRQQRYRARKREEKAKKNACVGQGDHHNACHGALPEYLPLLGMPNVANGLPAMKHDMGFTDTKAIKEKNQTRQLEGYDIHHIESRQQHHTAFILETIVQEDADTSHGHDHHTLHAPKVLQPLSEMEDDFHVNTPHIHGHFKNHYDIMTRRLKNRERQRRYRARKRVEADMKNADLGNQSTYLQSHRCGAVAKLKSRLHRHRDWKKDARQTHAFKAQKGVQIELLSPALSLSSEPAANDLYVQVKETTLEGVFHLENAIIPSGYEANDSMHGRRHWKAAARNKVD